MLTKNFYNAAMTFFTGKITTNGMHMPGGSYNNLYPYQSGINLFKSMCYVASSSESSGTMFGTGTTPSTVDDYKIEKYISANEIGFTNQTDFSFGTEDGCLIARASFGLTNISSEAIPVSEVCYYAPLYYGSGSSSSKPCLLDRTVLEEPITINPGETKQLTYTIRMNYPTA